MMMRMGQQGQGQEPWVLVTEFDPTTFAPKDSTWVPLHFKVEPADSSKPCPKSCATRISTVDVHGLPDGRGVRRMCKAGLRLTGQMRFDDFVEPLPLVIARFVPGGNAQSAIRF